jgi:hypothetical protein
LLAKGEVFERQFRAGVEGGTQRLDEVEKQGYHRETMHGVGGYGQTSATVGKRAARMSTWRTTGLGKVVALILTKPRAQEATPEQAGSEVDTDAIRAAS